MQVVDPHIHLWDLGRISYPWLKKPGVNFLGDYSSLARNHLPADFLADASDIDVLKVVHIDAVAADPMAETRWLQELADSPSSRGIPHAIVAMTDLSRPDAEAMLAFHAGFRNARGIRQILNRHADAVYNYVARDYMDEPEWRANFRLLRKYGLSFDLQLYPAQMSAAAILAAENPDTAFIINHTGMFVDRDRIAAFAAWRDGMRALAERTNVFVKLSGLGMFDHAWTVESLRPYVLETIATFGVARCMFASNFPVDRPFSSYSALWRAYAAIVAGASGDEKVALFRQNAERIYRI